MTYHAPLGRITTTSTTTTLTNFQKVKIKQNDAILVAKDVDATKPRSYLITDGPYKGKKITINRFSSIMD